MIILALISGSGASWRGELAARMQNALRLKAGDILIFGKTKGGELLLGGRARTASDKDRKAPPRTRKTTEEKQVIKSEHGSLPPPSRVLVRHCAGALCDALSLGQRIAPICSCQFTEAEYHCSFA